MFAALGRLVYRRRRSVAIVAVALAFAAGALGTSVGGTLSTGGWIGEASGSALVAERLDEAYGGGGATLVVVYEGPPGTAARSAGFQDAVAASLAGLVDDEAVTGITGYRDVVDDRFIALDGSGTFVIVELAVDVETAVDEVARLRGLIGPIEGVDIDVSGHAAATFDANELTQADLVRAETIALPLALLVLIVVFGSLVAAVMPLLVAILAIITTLGLISALASATEMSIFVLNVSTMLGLALAIDYSLFLVARYREELAAGRDVATAIEHSVATVGKAVVFSAVAVGIGLSGLLFFRSAALTSIGVAGIVVVVASALYAVTLLPAMLGILGTRIDALGVGGLLARVGNRGRARRVGVGREIRPVGAGGAWERLAATVMRRPWAVLLPTLAILLLLGAPFLQIRQAVPDAAIFPAGMESRDGAVALQERFAAGETSPIVILADVEGDPTSAANAATLAEYASAVEAVEGISRVDSPFSNVRDPFGGQALDPEQFAFAYAEPAIRDALRPLLDRYVRGSTVRFDAISPYPTTSAEVSALVEEVRAVAAVAPIETAVGGAHAAGVDFLAAMDERVPWMLVTVAIGMLVALFLLFGSIVLPIKAILMTLLSVAASFGALVWVFQEGNLQEVVGFEAPGYTVAGTPIVMFAIVIGLSMDYEVLMLSRMQESVARTRDNTRAVAEGLARTGSVITGAALIMVVVFASFALADVVAIKALGVGMAIAVLLDATVVRMLLVPATMRLLGEWNWWAPAPLRRLADRAGFSHVEVRPAEPVGGHRALAGGRPESMARTR